eukprot:CAMPEP_0178419720 /NCGR_PEP_ID=MMETSP0689_2-20121128/25756_1 /TAXON_ID=160604 /ORGANISM="Amphidinium massartii, Strain CS-259" /LENGTH=329 /DNA_ID=CAMNT_0020041167 /DNA_START=73 /DNA_END=1062 /DNA_ORIENTATION=+
MNNTAGESLASRGTVPATQVTWNPYEFDFTGKEGRRDSLETGILAWLAEAKEAPQPVCTSEGQPDSETSSAVVHTVAGDVVMDMQGDIEVIRESFIAFLHTQVATSIATSEQVHSRHVEALVFLDYVPLNVSFSVYATSGKVVAVFRETYRKDVLLFHRLVADSVDYLAAAGVQVLCSQENSGKCRPAAVLDVDFDDDFSDDDEDFTMEQDWASVAPAMVKSLCSTSVQVREEAVRVLARVAKHEPCSRPHIAKVLLPMQEAVNRMLLQDFQKRPLEELYPVAMMLSSVASCPEAANILGSCKVMSSMFAILRGVPQMLDLVMKGLDEK